MLVRAETVVRLPGKRDSQTKVNHRRSLIANFPEHFTGLGLVSLHQNRPKQKPLMRVIQLRLQRELAVEIFREKWLWYFLVQLVKTDQHPLRTGL
jgi:hypothetical protein